MLINKSEQRELEAQSETGMVFAIERCAEFSQKWCKIIRLSLAFPTLFNTVLFWVENICFLVLPSYDSCL